MTLRVRLSLPADRLAAFITAQCNAFFPDGDTLEADSVMSVMPDVLARLEHCFTAIDDKYFFDGNGAVFSHLHGDQYAMALYLVGNQMFKAGAPANACAKLFLLNKTLHGCDIFYEVELPGIFLLVHPLGTVLGRASYSDYFISYQRVSVGSNHNVYPYLGRHVTLRPGAGVLGKCRIGDMCQIAADSLVIDRDLPSGSVYIGNPKTMQIKPQTEAIAVWRTGNPRQA